jgi:hypothetical protein
VNCLADYEGQTPYAFESLQEKWEPTGLASGDFDEDGMPDLVCAYATKSAASSRFDRGNVDAVLPKLAGCQSAKSSGYIFRRSIRVRPLKSFAVFDAPESDGDWRLWTPTGIWM